MNNMNFAYTSLWIIKTTLNNFTSSKICKREKHSPYIIISGKKTFEYQENKPTIHKNNKRFINLFDNYWDTIQYDILIS